jgi:D-hexose-6-phosphate mutarotase
MPDHLAYVGRFDGTNSKHASPAMAAAGAGTSGARDVDVTAVPTSTKWSVLSSRIEGLAMEMAQVVGGMDAYCVSMSNAEGPVMKAVREKMLATPWAEEWENQRTMFSYGEEMSTDPLEAMMLKQFVHMAQPKRILEVGMFVGFGAVAMMEGSSNAKVVSLEIDPYLKKWLGDCLQPFPDFLKRHEIMLGPALDSLPKLTGQFDMVFVDANKSEYKRYVELILERDLIAPGGTIVCDNILYNGYPYLNSHFDSQPARRGFGNDIRDFNDWVCKHDQLEQVLLPIRDGVSLLRKKPAFDFSPAPRLLEPVSGSVVELRHSSGGTCRVSTYAAHLLSWCPTPGNEQIFLGEMAEVGKPGLAIRGGVPICWPQFGTFENASDSCGMVHGFARNKHGSKWTLLRQSEDSVSLLLKSDDETRKSWAKDFEFVYTVSLGKDTVRMEMEVHNDTSSPLEFTGCLHSYWKCSSIEKCAVQGLKGAAFDTGIGSSFRGDAIEDRSAVPFSDAKQTQLYYGDAGDAVTLVEDGKRRLRLTKSNLPDWILWNTGAENGSNIKDLREGEYKKYVCVEPGFASKPIKVAPGATWIASHEARLL